ncbi:MAG: Uma2 family endonuclease [Chloroflexota bacterium]|nr:Uma2 family endonuclease [Chloroflexota bacterium]
MAVQMPRRRFTVDDYERMAEAGILTEDDRVELIAGEIVEMAAIGIRHAGCVTALTDLLSELVGREVSISVQNAVRLAEDGEPQPDVAVLKRGRYQRVRPTVADILLVIEVAEPSRDYDRNVKMPLYAAAGIPEVWLVDLIAQTVERHTEPHDGRYSLIALAGRGQSLASTVLPGVTIAVDDILGPQE